MYIYQSKEYRRDIKVSNSPAVFKMRIRSNRLSIPSFMFYAPYQPPICIFLILLCRYHLMPIHGMAIARTRIIRMATICPMLTLVLRNPSRFVNCSDDEFMTGGITLR